jgi:UDP-N-acetylmuramoylalanine--D-glutamate ligase
MKDSCVAVLGLARSGTALCRALRSRGVAVRASDRRSEAQISAAEELRGIGVTIFPGGDRSEVLDGAGLLAVSPGVPASNPVIAEARRRGVPVRSELEVAWRMLEEENPGAHRYTAVTGTNGKSTVTTWIAEILRRAGRPVVLAGNIGVPLSEFSARAEPAEVVLEVSSFQLESCETFRPDVAVITNVTPDHLDRHENFAAYKAAKARIFARQRGDDFVVLNADDPGSAGFSPRSRVVRFSRGPAEAGGIGVEGGALVSRIAGEPRAVARVEEIGLPGVHNLENALAAAAASECRGAPREAIASGLAEFEGLPHRSRFVAEAGGVRWVNDSKGTNPDAVLKSLAGYRDGSVILIAGGSEKGSDFSILRNEAARACAAVLTIGKAAAAIEAALDGLPVRRAERMEDAVEIAMEIARPGMTVLLSPACASFDQYENFERRGEHFESLVRAMTAGAAHGA